MKTEDGTMVVCGSQSKISDDKSFHEHWEDIQYASGKILESAYNADCSLNDWIDACNAAQDKIERLKYMGCYVKHGIR